MEHKITTENILKAAEKCPQAKETLKTMFPEAFKQAPIIIKGDHLRADDKILIAIEDNKIYLNSWAFTWEIKKDDDCSDALLIPTRK